MIGAHGRGLLCISTLCHGRQHPICECSSVEVALTALGCSGCRPEDAARAKYSLQHTVRTHLGCDDDAYQCEGYGEDKEGFRGGFMKQDVIKVAQRALEMNLTALAKELTPRSVKVGGIPPQTLGCSGYVPPQILKPTIRETACKKFCRVLHSRAGPGA